MQDNELSGSESDSDSDHLEDDAAIAKAKAFASVVKKSGNTAPKTGSVANDTLAAAMAELDMDNYDDDDSGDELVIQRILGAGNPGMAYHRDPKQDPYGGEKFSVPDANILFKVYVPLDNLNRL